MNRTSVAYLCVALVAGALAMILLTKPASLEPQAAPVNSPAAAPIVAAALAAFSSGTVYIEADEESAVRGYEGWEVTQFRPERHLIEAIRTGGVRSRKVLIEHTPNSSIEFDVVTEVDHVVVLYDKIDASTLKITIDGAPVSEATGSPQNGWNVVQLGSFDHGDIEQSLLLLEIVGLDENLNAHVQTWGTFAHLLAPPPPPEWPESSPCQPDVDVDACDCNDLDDCPDPDGCGWIYVDCSCVDEPLWIVPEIGEAHTGVACGQWHHADGLRWNYYGQPLYKLANKTCHIIACCPDGTPVVKSCCRWWQRLLFICSPWPVPHCTFGSSCPPPPGEGPPAEPVHDPSAS